VKTENGGIMQQERRYSERKGHIMYEDKTLVCKDCGAEFVFTAGEQEFYAEKGFVNEPKRCKSCRDAKKNASGNKPERENVHSNLCCMWQGSKSTVSAERRSCCILQRMLCKDEGSRISKHKHTRAMA